MPMIISMIWLILHFISLNQSPYTASSVKNKTKTNQFIIEPPTLVCAGFEWTISGDENRNANVAVSYRRSGDKVWQSALPLLRIGDEKYMVMIRVYLSLTGGY